MHALDRIPLRGLRVVEAVARLGSLSRAADELGTTPGAVSQQVSRTEQALGIALFLRTRRGMEPTEEAQEFLAGLGEGFSRLSGAVERLTHRRDDVVTVSVAPIFATRWLIWRLRDFYEVHPGVTVRLDPDVALVDPALSGTDLGIRVGPGQWRGVKAEPLFDQLVIPVCNEKLAGQLEEPADLARVPIIREPQPMYDWNDWLVPEGLDASILGPGPEFPEASMCLDAAISGLGVFLAFEVLVHDRLHLGPLATPFPRYQRTGMTYALVSAPDRSLSPAAQLFRRWLKARIVEEGLGTPEVPQPM